MKQSSAKLLVFSAGGIPFYEIFRFPFTRSDWILPVWKGTEWKLGPFIKTREHGRFFSIKVYRDRLILSIDNNASREDRIITALETRYLSRWLGPMISASRPSFDPRRSDWKVITRPIPRKDTFEINSKTGRGRFHAGTSTITTPIRSLAMIRRGLITRAIRLKQNYTTTTWNTRTSRIGRW